MHATKKAIEIQADFSCQNCLSGKDIMLKTNYSAYI